MTNQKIPFGPGHPCFDKQMDLFESTIEVSPPNDERNCRVKVAENLWYCPVYIRTVEAKDLPSAKRKLGAGSQPEPALIEYGGYAS